MLEIIKGILSDREFYGKYFIFIGLLALIIPSPLIKLYRWQLENFYKNYKMTEEQYLNNIKISRIMGIFLIIIGILLYLGILDKSIV